MQKYTQTLKLFKINIQYISIKSNNQKTKIDCIILALKIKPEKQQTVLKVDLLLYVSHSQYLECEFIITYEICLKNEELNYRHEKNDT